MPQQWQPAGDVLTVRHIAFRSGHETCHGSHYVPLRDRLMTARGAAPCVILAHGFGGTADAGLEPYARRFAESGLHAITFDYRYFGASEGAPRQLLSIRRQLQDWHAAIAFARAQEGIDAQGIILWGVSLSGGHVVHAAARDEDVCAVIAQYPMLDGFAALRNVHNYSGYRQIMQLLVAGTRDYLNSLFGREAVTIPIVGAPGHLAALSTPDAEPGYRAIATPQWQNAVCARIALTIPFYRPGFLLDRITCPVLIQVATHDTILPPSSITRFVCQTRPHMQIKHYPAGHFDAFHGRLFDSSAEDQVNFILTALGESNHENNPAQ